MIRHAYQPRQLVLVLMIVGLFVVIRPVAHAEKVQVDPVTSPLVLEAIAAPVRGSVSVTGHSFTQGGSVYIAFYDQWGTGLFETRWITASEPIYGPDGSQDPAKGFSPGGTFSELFGEGISFYGPNGSQEPSAGFNRVDANGIATGPMCATTPMVRAYDQGSATWSEMIDVDSGC